MGDLKEDLIEKLSKTSKLTLPSTVERCIRCNTCKYSSSTFYESCPSGEKSQS